MKDAANNEHIRIFELKESMWFCLCALTPQGGGDTPINLSGRLLCASWWMFGCDQLT